MLSEIYPGGAPKMGSTYWDQILEVGVITVSRRVLKRLHEFLEQVEVYLCTYFILFYDGEGVLVNIGVVLYLKTYS